MNKKININRKLIVALIISMDIIYLYQLIKVKTMLYSVIYGLILITATISLILMLNYLKNCKHLTLIISLFLTCQIMLQLIFFSGEKLPVGHTVLNALLILILSIAFIFVEKNSYKTFLILMYSFIGLLVVFLYLRISSIVQPLSVEHFIFSKMAFFVELIGRLLFICPYMIIAYNRYKRGKTGNNPVPEKTENTGD